MTDPTIRIKVDAQSAKDGARVIKRELSDIDGSAKKAERGVAGLKQEMKSLATGAAGFARELSKAGIALGGLFSAIVIRNTIAQEQAVRQLEQAIKSTGGAAGFSSSELRKMASSLQNVTTFGDEAILSMQSVLLTFTSIRGPAFERTTEAVLNLSARMGQDLQSSAVQLGKALNDPVANLGALSRSGIQFADDQKAVIKALAESGRIADAQTIILEELETQFGGAATAARDTFGGALSSLKNAAGDLLEADGQSLADVQRAINDLTDLLQDPQTVQGINAFVGALVGGLAKVIDFGTKASNAVRFMAESLAASIAGPALGDVVRLEDELAKVNSEILKLGETAEGSRSNAGSNQIAELEHRRDELERLLELSRELDAAADELNQDVNINVNVNSTAGVEGGSTPADEIEKIKAALQSLRDEALTPTERTFADFQAQMATLQAGLAEGFVNESEFSELAERFKAQYWDKILEDGKAATDEAARTIEEALSTLDFGADVSAGFDKISNSLIGVVDAFELMTDAQSEFADLRKEFARDEESLLKIQQREQLTQIGLYGDLAASAKGFFDEGSAGYEALEAAEKAFRAVQIAEAATAAAVQLGLIGQTTAAQLAADGIKAASSGVAAAVSSMVGLPFPANLAALAATVAAISALGVQLFGGGGGGGSGALTAEQRQSEQGRGTVLGDMEAQSESIQKAMDVTAEATESLVGINTQMLDALNRLSGQVDNAAAELTRIGGTTGFGFAGSLAGGDGIFGTLAEYLTQRVDSGLRVQASTLADALMQPMIDAYAGFLNGDFRYAELTDGLADDLSNVFSDIGSVVLDAVGVLGVSAELAAQRLRDETFDTLLVSLEGLEGDDLIEALAAVFSTVGDQAAAAVLPMLDEFQRLGEGALETLARLSNNVTVAREALDRIGQSITVPGELEGISIQLPGFFGDELFTISRTAEDVARDTIAVSTALIEAAGGLGEFVDSTNSFIDEFLSDAEQLAVAQRDVERAAEGLGVTLPTTRDGFADLLQGFEITDEASAQLYAGLLDLVPVMDDLFDRAEAITRGADAFDAAIGLNDGLNPLRDALEDVGITLGSVRDAALDGQVGLQAVFDELSDVERAALEPFIDDILDLVPASQQAAEGLVNVVDLLEQIDDVSQRLARAQVGLAGGSVAAFDLDQVSAQVQAAASISELIALIPSVQDALQSQYDEGVAAIDAAASAAIDAARNQADAELEVIDAQIDGMEALITSTERLRDIAGDLRDFVTDFARSELAGGTPLDRANTALDQFRAQSALAQSGDETAARGLESLASETLRLAQDAFASGAGFQAIRAEVLGTVEAVADAIDVPSTAEAELDALLALRDTLESSVEAQIAALEAQSASQIEALRETLSGSFNDLLAAVDTLRTSAEADAATQAAALDDVATAIVAAIDGQSLTIGGIVNSIDTFTTEITAAVLSPQQISQIALDLVDALAPDAIEALLLNVTDQVPDSFATGLLDALVSTVPEGGAGAVIDAIVANTPPDQIGGAIDQVIGLLPDTSLAQALAAAIGVLPASNLAQALGSAIGVLPADSLADALEAVIGDTTGTTAAERIIALIGASPDTAASLIAGLVGASTESAADLIADLVGSSAESAAQKITDLVGNNPDTAAELIASLIGSAGSTAAEQIHTLVGSSPQTAAALISALVGSSPDSAAEQLEALIGDLDGHQVSDLILDLVGTNPDTAAEFILDLLGVPLGQTVSDQLNDAASTLASALERPFGSAGEFTLESAGNLLDTIGQTAFDDIRNAAAAALVDAGLPAYEYGGYQTAESHFNDAVNRALRLGLDFLPASINEQQFLASLYQENMINALQGIDTNIGFYLPQIEDHLEAIRFMMGEQNQSQGLQTFAKGGVFTNQIVDRPTLFPIGLMGEAGTEAIMPLRRGPDGSLGVTASGVDLRPVVQAIHQHRGETEHQTKLQVKTNRLVLTELKKIRDRVDGMEQRERLRVPS